MKWKWHEMIWKWNGHGNKMTWNHLKMELYQNENVMKGTWNDMKTNRHEMNMKQNGNEMTWIWTWKPRWNWLEWKRIWYENGHGKEMETNSHLNQTGGRVGGWMGGCVGGSLAKQTTNKHCTYVRKLVDDHAFCWFLFIGLKNIRQANCRLTWAACPPWGGSLPHSACASLWPTLRAQCRHQLQTLQSSCAGLLLLVAIHCLTARRQQILKFKGMFKHWYIHICIHV